MMAASTRQQNSNPLSEALRRCKTGFGAVVLFSFIINLLMLTAPLYMLQVFDRVLTSHSLSTLLYLTLIAFFAFAILWALDIVRGRVMITLGTWLDRRISGDVLAASLRNGAGARNPSIQPLRDVGTLRGFFTGPAIFPILDAPWTPLFIGLVFLLHPLLGWIGLCGALLLFLFALLNELATRSRLARAGLSQARALDDAQSAVRNIDAIEAMGLGPHIARRWTQAAQFSLDEQAAASRASGLITASSKAVRQLLQIVLLAAGAWLVLASELSAGGMIASSILLGRALAPVEQAISSWRSAIAARDAYRRIKQLLAAAAQPSTFVPLPEPKGALLVDGVSFTYAGAKQPILQNIAFALQPGAIMGLIGPTASGKSTLGRLLAGALKPQSGHVRLDGADLAEWDARDRGQYIGYLPQDIELFNGTVRENISRMAEGDPEAVYEAARLVGAHEDILALPGGYETQIGIGGIALSGGQRQRIGLARAAYGRPKLIVLDEPNSGLDSQGEKALLSAIHALGQAGSTVIVIAHRPGILAVVQQILVLRQGAVEMLGGRDEVLARLMGAQTPAVPPPKPAQKWTVIQRPPAA